MASGGSTGRTGSGSRSFDFGSDDVLCAYDDFPPNEAPNGATRRSDPSAKEFHESRRPLVNVYGQQEGYTKDDVISAVDKCMKKYADNLLLFLEGISGRLSQLELYCYKLERSIGDLRSDMVRDQSEKELQLKSLEKHLQEVHRSVQILRDKQELADTQKELAKFQVVQKDPASDEGVAVSGVAVSEPKRHDEASEIPNQHLALVPRQTPAPTPPPAVASDQPPPAPVPVNMPQGHYILSQPGSFYVQRAPSPQDQQSQSLQQYVQARPQFQDQSLPQQQAFLQYQQQWSQPPPQQAVQHQQPQARPQTPPTYPPYPQHQPANAETYQGSMPMQVPYSTLPQPGASRVDGIPFGYGGPGTAASQPPQYQNIQRQTQPQRSQSTQGDASYPPQPNLQGYKVVYDSMGGSPVILPSHNIQPGSYNIPAGNTAAQHQPRQQPVRNQSFMEMVEKAVSMGYSREHAFGVMQRMAESGQPFDFNSLLDRLNAAGASPRVWSG